jgi:hypothetical protein
MRSILVGAMSTCASWVAAPAGSAQAPEAHDHGSGRLGKVSFPVSCAPEAGCRFERAMAVLHSFWWGGGRRCIQPGAGGRPQMRDGLLGSGDERLGATPLPEGRPARCSR